LGIELSAEFSRVDAQRLTEHMPDLAGQFAGLLGGTVRVSGSGATWDQVGRTTTGEAEILGRNVVLAKWQLPPSPSARVEAGGHRSAHFAQAAAKLVVSSHGINVEQFDGTPAPELGNPARAGRVHASGTIGFDRRIEITAEERDARQESLLEYRWAGSLPAPQLQPPASLARNAARSAAPVR
jgi:hypothetical protein